MTDIPPINGSGKLAATQASESIRLGRSQRTQGIETSGDRVEISEVGQTLSALDPQSDIRIDKVMEIREAIANGTYLTDEKIGIAADRLWDALRASAAK